MPPRTNQVVRRQSSIDLFRKISPSLLRRQVLLVVALIALGGLLTVRFIQGVSADTGTSSVSITALGTAVTENFDTLSNVAGSTTNTALPTGWYITEDGTSTRNNEQYAVDTGSSGTGDIYSYGSTSSTDRALGALGSGSLIPLYGAKFTNNTGQTITSLSVSYRGEEWRFGATGRTDRIDFQISINATDLTTGTYADVNALDFTTPNTTGTVGARDGNDVANRTNISSSITGLSIPNGASFFIRWTDFDASGAEDGLAVDDFSITASGSPADDAPTVTGSTPANSAANVAISSNIVINFSESVTATSSAFSIACPTGSPITFTQSASPSNSFTLDPTSDLPFSTTCTVTVTANQITDTDPNDPPDQVASNHTFAFTTQSNPLSVATNIIINEVDSDNPSTDTQEFIELYDGGVGNTSLNGLVVVFYNGNGDISYAAFDLDGYSTDANGYFVLGNAGVPGVDLVFADNFLQNGPDAVALYAANASDFPNGTAVTLVNVQDAFVYNNGLADDAGLLVLLNAGQPQVNESGGGSGATHSSQRCPNGTGGQRNTNTYTQGTPTPGAANSCVPPPPPSNSTVVISQVYGAGGNSGAAYQNDFVELYNRSASTVDLTGWSLQYASSTGSGWDFNKQPLGGTIAPGEYLLISLAGGANGSPLPPANIYGQINMSGTSGKIALVDNFDGLVGNCPTSDPHLKDLVGYGAADCGEGGSPAPAAGTTNAIFRLGAGATDTDNNLADFTTGPPNPRRTAPIVELGPLVLATDPRSNGVNAPRDATITVTFTEAVDVVGSWFDITCSMTGQHNSATFAGGDQTHYITPNVNFIAGEQCTVTIYKDQIHDQDLDDSGPNTDTPPANYVWSFTVATGTAPPYPSSVHLAMGNPSGAVASVAYPNNYLMEKPEFAMSYNRDFGRPNWVSWHLSDEWIGALTRVDTFRPDPAIPPDWYRVQSFDFSLSGFDRGHMVPNADRDKETSIPINQATFLMSNMIAQAPDNNQGPWAEFEGYLRTLLPANEIYIVAGGAGTGGTGSNGGVTNTLANGHVNVPEKTWKVALVIPKDSGDDISRISCGSRTIAVVLPNVQGIRNTPWDTYLTTVDAVEALTGYDFFSNLPEPVQRCIEAGTNGVNPPLDTDADGVPDTADNCPFAANADQADADNDHIGNECDPDDDNDGVLDVNDACPGTPSGTQVNAAGCPDGDGDGVADTGDNCVSVPNSSQADADHDGLGDVCDPDDDNDGVPDVGDNCPFTPNVDQADADHDGIGDVCDPDDDNDGVPDVGDNCPFTLNPDQRDTNGDGVGDACTAYQVPAGGMFVIGDKQAITGGATVYFWGSQWVQNNPMSGGSPPNSFKGFEDGSGPVACSGTWSTSGGNSTSPPATLPEYMAVVVSSSIQKNGNVISGNAKKIIIVRTNPGYSPAPGYSGTGTVVAIICQN